jgi:hypothetical protein
VACGLLSRSRLFIPAAVLLRLVGALLADCPHYKWRVSESNGRWARLVEFPPDFGSSGRIPVRYRHFPACFASRTGFKLVIA